MTWCDGSFRVPASFSSLKRTCATLQTGACRMMRLSGTGIGNIVTSDVVADKHVSKRGWQWGTAFAERAAIPKEGRTTVDTFHVGGNDVGRRTAAKGISHARLRRACSTLLDPSSTENDGHWVSRHQSWAAAASERAVTGCVGEVVHSGPWNHQDAALARNRHEIITQSSISRYQTTGEPGFHDRAHVIGLSWTPRQMPWALSSMGQDPADL
ncbi:hypothetical protein HBI56_205530 [Parastagonospora nodorum]|uniref:Uncharacterized protein n=2 Tax=Phaeosphaeria nodorum (strain SN15 / ATCC MYA-4574 / FGSC 10173) TaxID=321614 RepID=Q0UB92_PHANO|nr:hypothetical protein SNOG_10972 [Parastagonospora nodorum SN15]KAH3912474.1 hypothetical protein HBH56_115540 [Parastagonospora nodorum]EAT81471.1 hypothetical protein SNOG_10972 [Parastagonospora nodorum SN15]KAH3928846.1 hypothetical protein HBH54_133610 [Parastagonospora nodorum]KAH3950651.1 hypothetical protein HBH53_073910 [Parastagonospora nodorum]KAH3965932.1 hypothetical protein HBH51_147860 [Parastagonospora nodorum]